MKVEILFENDSFVVVNKPAGLLSIPDREGRDISLKRILQQKYTQIFTVHRLDKDTSGLIVFAKNEDSHKFLSAAFESRTVLKDYLGIVSGTLPEKEKSIDAPIIENSGHRGTMLVHHKGKPSLTDYEVMEEFGKYSLLRFRIHTGRTHQIRVHMQNEGHPILCDEIYGDAQPIRLSALKKNYKLSLKEDEERPILNRLALHAWKLSLSVERGEKLNLEAPLPKDMSALLQQLRKLKGKKQRP